MRGKVTLRMTAVVFAAGLAAGVLLQTHGAPNPVAAEASALPAEVFAPGKKVATNKVSAVVIMIAYCGVPNFSAISFPNAASENANAIAPSKPAISRSAIR